MTIETIAWITVIINIVVVVGNVIMIYRNYFLSEELTREIKDFRQRAQSSFAATSRIEG